MISFKKQLFTLLLLCSVSTISTAQQPDNKQSEYRGFYTLAPRIGIGFHNYANFEIGISALYIDNENFEFGAASIYSTFILQQTNWSLDSYYPGWKLGIQSSWAIFMCGIEYKTLIFENKNYNYLSPKIGLSWMDVLNLEYSINVIDLNNEIPINSRHQIAINMSVNKKIYKEVIKAF